MRNAIGETMNSINEGLVEPLTTKLVDEFVVIDFAFSGHFPGIDNLRLFFFVCFRLLLHPL
ncbi:hypothetical protein Hanom_Chr14g01257381 [Helianthus anomalus]